MDQRLARLAERLHEKTKSGNIKWEKSASRGFVASFPTYSIGLVLGESRTGSHVQMSIYNEEGELVESFSSTDLQATFGRGSVAPRGLVGPPDFEALMHDLYNTARRRALGADRVVDRILLDLDR